MIWWAVWWVWCCSSLSFTTHLSWHTVHTFWCNIYFMFNDAGCKWSLLSYWCSVKKNNSACSSFPPNPQKYVQINHPNPSHNPSSWCVSMIVRTETRLSSVALCWFFRSLFFPPLPTLVEQSRLNKLTNCPKRCKTSIPSFLSLSQPRMIINNLVRGLPCRC